MKKKLFLALLTTLLLLLAASTALAADYSDYTCTSCGNPCEGWYPLSDNSLNYHVPACYSCGIVLLDKKEHCTPEDGTATCKSAPRCNVCSLTMSVEYGPDPDAHSMVESWSYYNETQHFRVCQNVCGKTEYADHTGGTATCSTRAVCTDCGNEYGALSDTNHGEFSDWEPYTATQHYRYCIECSENREYADHTGGTATCTQQPECEVCHKPYGDLSDTNHGAFTEWTPIGDTQHYRHCMDCGMNEEYADHTGGTATCTQLAVCDVCHTQYGEFSDTNHGEFSDWMGVNNAQHLRYCTNCAMNTEYADHTGGTATCMEYAVCEVCHAPYGELSDTNHGEFTDWMPYTDDDTQHYRRCQDCGWNREYASHTGGTATCTERAVCDVCHGQYGELSDANHGEFTDWIHYDDTQHYRFCIECGENYEYADHTGGEATCVSGAICTVCNAPYGDIASEHTGPYTDWTNTSASQHYRVCLTCGQLEYGDHTVGTPATCLSSAICALCKEEYGSPDRTAHVGPFSAWQSNSLTQHYRRCTACNEPEYGDHTGGTATCAAQAVCDVCGEGYGYASLTHTGPCSYEYSSSIYHYISCEECGGTHLEEHFGGTATCTSGPICEGCKKAYGSALGGHDWGDWRPNYDGTHTRTCFNDPEHEETIDCSGGEATCAAPAECSDCYAPYGELSSEHGAYTDWRPLDGTQHFRYCSICGLNEDYGDHVPGTPATCISFAICSICNSTYGSEDLNVHAGPFGFWIPDGDGHARQCLSCNGYELGEHSGGEATCEYGPSCDLCHEIYNWDSALGHDWGDWTTNGGGTHTRVCQNDATHTETEDCSGGEATCESSPVCEVCNGKYGPSLGGHDWGNWESGDDGTHTRVCSRDATHKETGTCSGGTATCTAPAVCAVCETSYGSADPDAHDLELVGYTPATCIVPGLESYLCQREGCPNPEHETVLPAFGQHLYNHWDILGGNMHHTDCTVCGENADVGCTLWGMYDGETLLTVCPVCGDFLDRPFAVLIAREDAAVPIGTLLVRGLKEPVPGALYGFTVAGVYGGEVVDIHAAVTITIPVEAEAFTVVRVEIIEGIEYRTEIPFTLENGQLTIETDTAGLFLLVPAE